MSQTDPTYDPCARCGTDQSETIAHDGTPLCEGCRNATVCACEICRAEDPLAPGAESAR